jgi:hypothetical protein
MADQRLPFDLPEHGAGRRTWKIAGVALALLMLAGVAYFGLGGGKGLRGLFLSQQELYHVQVSVDKTILTSDGDLQLAYSVKNDGAVDIKKNAGLVSKVFINSDTVPAFVKPWSADGTSVFRAGESVTYQLRVPRAMFPRETYSVSGGGDSNAPSVNAFKKLYVTVFALNDQGQEDKVVSSAVVAF